MCVKVAARARIVLHPGRHNEFTRARTTRRILHNLCTHAQRGLSCMLAHAHARTRSWRPWRPRHTLVRKEELSLPKVLIWIWPYDVHAGAPELAWPGLACAAYPCSSGGARRPQRPHGLRSSSQAPPRVCHHTVVPSQARLGNFFLYSSCALPSHVMAAPVTASTCGMRDG